MKTFEDSGYRTCFVCGRNIGSAGNRWEYGEQISKASAVPIGGRQQAVAHDACLKSLQATYDEYESGQDSQLTSDFKGRQAEIGHGGSMTGGESGVGVNHLLNRPCVVCRQQVTRGSIMRISGMSYAAHPACRERALTMIADALDVDHLAENRQGSIVGMAER